MASSYVGRSPEYGFLDYQELTGFNGVQTTFTLNYGVPSSTGIMVVLNGVLQQPTTAYSVSAGGEQVIFSEAPATGTAGYIIYMAKQVYSFRPTNMNVGVYTFTGSAYTQLVLAETPMSSSSIQLFIDGVYQSYTTKWTLSGNTITLVTPMTSGQIADVVFLTKERISLDTVADGAITRLKYAVGSLVAEDVVVTPSGSMTSTNVQDALTWLSGRLGATGGGNNAIFHLNEQTVNTSYSIPSGKNAGTFGPISIADGVTVTIPDGSAWSIV